jgi:gamma-glutamyltranspeptidase/glutathione hydrolase
MAVTNRPPASAAAMEMLAADGNAVGEGKPIFAFGLPGAHRIPAAAMQTVLNIIDHGMTLQEAVEAPRVFTQGQEAEIEKGFPEQVRAKLAALGHAVAPVDHVAGG